jgi:hypothetical protein
MEMRRIVFIEVHRYHDAEESTNLGHGQLSLLLLLARTSAVRRRYLPIKLQQQDYTTTRDVSQVTQALRHGDKML